MPDVPQQDPDVPQQEPDVKVEEEVEEPSSEKSKLFVNNAKNDYYIWLLLFFRTKEGEQRQRTSTSIGLKRFL